MIGRGIIADPCLAERIKEECGDSTYDWNRFFIFHDELYRNYCESDVGRGNTMFKMKELWAYWSRLFYDVEGAERLLRRSGRLEIMVSMRRQSGCWLHCADEMNLV